MKLQMLTQVLPFGEPRIVIIFVPVIGLTWRMEERPPIWRVAANIFNKQSWTVDKGWSSSLGVGRGANNPSL